MTNYCSYKGCDSLQRPFSSKTFFNLPVDDRRSVWIANSGNESLKDINTNLRKVFCQDHFDPKYLRRQFNRTILRKDAVPYPYGETPEVHEIEFIEMAESEDESEQNEHKATAPASSESKVVILWNKIADTAAKSPTSNATRRVQDRQALKVPKNIKRKADAVQKPVQSQDDNDKDEEIDFIVLEETSQEVVANEANQSDQNVCKRMRIKLDKTTSESTQEEKVKEIAGQPQATAPPLPPKPSKANANTLLSNLRLLPLLPRQSTDGVVSSTEAFDADNDEIYYALSLVSTFKRLSPHKRAIAKCHIQRILTEIEYGSSSLP